MPANNPRSSWDPKNPWSDAALGRTPTNEETHLGVRWELDKKRDQRAANERRWNAEPVVPPVTGKDPDPGRKWTRDDVLQASSQILGMQASGRHRGEVHPLAEQWIGREGVREADRFSIFDALVTADAAQGGRSYVPGDERGEPLSRNRVLALGSASANLSRIIADSVQGEATSTFDEVSGDLLAITKPIATRDFKPVAHITTDGDALQQISEGGLIQSGVLHGTAEDIAALSFGLRVFVSRQMVINDDLGTLVSAVQSIAGAQARSELSMVVGLLESNGNLSDGEAIFSANAENLLTTTALDAAGLDSARSALRKLKTANGLAGNAKAGILLVPAALEGEADRLLVDAGQESLRVVVSVDLDETGDWFLLPSPTAWPVLGRAVPTWTDRGFLVEPMNRLPSGDEIRRADGDGNFTLPAGAFDAAAGLTIRRDTGFSVLSRHCIRCEA